MTLLFTSFNVSAFQVTILFIILTILFPLPLFFYTNNTLSFASFFLILTILFPLLLFFNTNDTRFFYLFLLFFNTNNACYFSNTNNTNIYFTPNTNYTNCVSLYSSLQFCTSVLILIFSQCYELKHYVILRNHF